MGSLRGLYRRSMERARHGRLVLDNNGKTSPSYEPLFINPSAAPSVTGVKGSIYFDSSANAPKFHTGSGWTTVASQGVDQPFLGLVSFPRKTFTAAATLAATDSGALCVFNSAAGDIYTLPTAAAGLWFDFVVAVTATSNVQKIITASASEFLLGTFVQSTDGTYTSALQSANGTTIRAWSGNGTTTGGIKGDWFRVTAISATQWVIWGMGSATGSEATPFATS